MSKKWLLFTSFFSFIGSVSASSQICSELKETNSISNHQDSRYEDVERDPKSSSAVSYDDLPFEIFEQIVKYLDDNSLTRFRNVSRTSSKAVENRIKDITVIKLPLSCLTNGDIKHPYPHTISHFLRKHLRSTFTDNPPQIETYELVSEFCDEWNYIGRDLFSQSKEKNLDRFLINSKLIPINSKDNRDFREIQLLLLIKNFKTNINLTSNSSDSSLNDLLTTASNMPDLEKKEIASNYLSLLAQSLSRKFHLEAITRFYQFCADQGHRMAQSNLGIVLYNIGNKVEAKKYFQLAADQGYSAAQNNLAVIFKEEGNKVDAKKYFQLAADQGYSAAQNSLAFIFKKEGNKVDAKKYFQLAADQGYSAAQNNLAVIFKEEGNNVEAKKYFQLAADQGYSAAQNNLAFIFKEEGNKVDAKKYSRLSADQGDKIGQSNFGVILFMEGKKVEAKKYFQLAADQGHQEAQMVLETLFNK